MEYLNGGSLKSLIVNAYKQGQKISTCDASRIVKLILETVSYLHSIDIAHRDLKPENIMFRKKNDIESLKIIDFGLSAKDVDDFSLTSKCGTIIFMAPEIFSNYQYTKVNIENDIVVCGFVECGDNKLHVTHRKSSNIQTWRRYKQLHSETKESCMEIP
jgi:serine/threonine protein kinase